MDNHKGVGEEFLYYATPTMEIAFHELVRMPNSDREEAIVEKVQPRAMICFQSHSSRSGTWGTI